MPTVGLPYPFDPVSVSGTLITMDMYLNDPGTMLRRVADIAAQEFYAHKIYSAGPGITGGALLFERPNPLLTDLYAERRLQEMAPGTRAPLLTFVRGVPMVQTPRQIGGEFEFTKQELKRNNPILVENAMTQTGNTIARDLEIMALSELNAVIASTARTFAAGTTLAAAAATTWNTRTAANQHAADIARLVATIHNEQRGAKINSAVYNTLDWSIAQTIYAAAGGDGNAGARAMLDANGISTVDVSVQVAQGTALFYEAGQVGVWDNEFPLEHDSRIEKQRDNVRVEKFTISPLMAVTDQFRILKMTGL